MKEIVLSGFVKTRSKWSGTDPWTIAFVYTPDGDFVIKGMSEAVKTYVKSHFQKYIVNYTFWKNKSCKMLIGWSRIPEKRGYWSSSRNIFISDRELSGHKKYEINVRTENGTKIIQVRRVPRKWLDIYNQAK